VQIGDPARRESKELDPLRKERHDLLIAKLGLAFEQEAPGMVLAWGKFPVGH
jgi:hypothetical protein